MIHSMRWQFADVIRCSAKPTIAYFHGTFRGRDDGLAALQKGPHTPTTNMKHSRVDVALISGGTASRGSPQCTDGAGGSSYFPGLRTLDFDREADAFRSDSFKRDTNLFDAVINFVDSTITSRTCSLKVCLAIPSQPTVFARKLGSLNSDFSGLFPNRGFERRMRLGGCGQTRRPNSSRWYFNNPCRWIRLIR